MVRWTSRIKGSNLGISEQLSPVAQHRGLAVAQGHLVASPVASSAVLNPLVWLERDDGDRLRERGLPRRHIEVLHLRRPEW